MLLVLADVGGNGVIRYHQFMTAITGPLFDLTGNGLLADLWTHHMGRILDLQWAVEAERMNRIQQRRTEALHELGIYQQ